MSGTWHMRAVVFASLAAVFACGGDGPTTPPVNDGATQLVLGQIAQQMAGEPFQVMVTLANAQGAAVAATAASTITLSTGTGSGGVGGTRVATLAAGSSSVTFPGVLYDGAESGVRLRATGSGGTANAMVALSNPFDLLFDFSGDLLAFVRSPQSNRTDVHLLKPHSSAWINLTDRAGHDTDPSWSPDGSRIAFVSTRAGNADLWVMNVDGSGLVQVTNDQGSVRFPSWTPDGSRILYSANVGGQRDLYMVDAPAPGSASSSVATPVQLTDDPGVDNEPVILPASVASAAHPVSAGNGADAFTVTDAKLVFFSNRGGKGAVYSMTWTIEGPSGSVFEFAPQLEFGCAPGQSWALVGGEIKITFVGRQGSRYDIYTADIDGSNTESVTRGAANAFYSTFARVSGASAAHEPGHYGTESSHEEELRVIFDSDHVGGRSQLFSIRLDGTGLFQLTGHPSDNEMPRWRPSPGAALGPAALAGATWDAEGSADRAPAPRTGARAEDAMALAATRSSSSVFRLHDAGAALAGSCAR